MSESNWKDILSPCCLYVYSGDTETIRAEELVTAVDGVVEAISVPDPADQRGGNRFIVLLNNEENKRYLENHGIIYQGRRLIVESSNNTCDIPNEWERFVNGSFQQPLQYPSGQQTSQGNDVYANVPSVQNIPMPSPQHYIGQQMSAPPGQQNPMNPGPYPFMTPFYMQGIPPNMYPQEGAVGQNVPAEAGNFPNPQQLWLQMQQLQLFYQMHGGVPGTEGATAAHPPPYTPTEEKSSSMQDSLESTATKSKQSYSDLQSSDGESVTPSAPDEEVQEDDESVQETRKSEAAMIKVTNIPDGTSKDALLFFFENRRKSGGGSVEDLEYDPDTKSAVITFEEPEAVKRVIGKLPILFNGVQIGVEEFRPDVRVDDFSEEAGEDSENILEVRGVSSRTSEDTVMMYFENTRRSGGGEIKSMKSEDGVFYIIFEDDQAIEKVLKKQHKIDGTAIKVCRYVPPPPPKPVPMYSNKVFITNISEKTTKDGLENFLEAKTNITPVSIEYGELEGTALITFEEDIDFEKLQLACKKRTLDKSHLEISRVPITNCAIVRNISERTSRDTLEFYFDNEKRSGVSGVLDVKMLDGFCLVYFEEPEAVDVVCRRTHRIDEQDLDVKIYFECLGQVESDDEPFKPPASLEISDFDPKKLQFLIKSPSNQQAVEKQLEAVYGKPIWPKKSKSNSLTVECTLTPETKDCRKLARTWETKVKENLYKFLDLLHVCKHTTLQEAFPLVLNELKSLTISNPDAVAVVLEKSNHEIYVTGHKQAVTDVSKQVSDIIVKVDQELDRKKQQVQEEKQLKRHLVLILQFCKFEQELQKKYKDISLKYDISKNLVKFEGLSGEVTSAIVEMYEFTSKVVKTEVKFSRLLQQFLQQQPVYMYVNSKMKERNIIGIWKFCKEEETLTVFSMSDQQAVQAARLIKGSVIETPIKLTNESTNLLPSEEWKSKVVEIEQNAQGLVKIMAQADQGRIIILCTDQWEGLAREHIEDFMLANTIYEESLNLKPAMMRYLQMNCANDLQNVGINLQQEKVNVVVNNTGIVIKAAQTGLNQAKYAIDKIVKGVEKQTHSINKAGIRKHMESSAGQEKLKKVERSKGVVIEVSDESASDVDTSSSWLTTFANRQELAVCVTKEGKKISAMVVDMLELDVDVIVNSANKDMKLIGGIAKIIVEKGGRSIQDECNDYVRKKGRLMEGQVFLSAAGKLMCKGVIHALGPVWQNGTNQEEEYLREAVFKSLEVTSERRLTSIAFPALCTGVFRYPVLEATRVIVVAVRDFFKENSGSSVEAVYLCGVEKETVNCFATAMMREMKNVILKSEKRENQWKFAQVPVSARKSDPGVDISGKIREEQRPVEDMRSVTLVIYGKDANQIRNAIRIIEEGMDDVLWKKTYNERIITSFSESQKNELQKLQKDFGVDVNVETRIGRITLHGLMEDVMAASEKVHNMIRKAETIQQEKQAAEMMADMVEWCFLDASTVPSKLEKYPAYINLQLEKALRKQESMTSFCDAEGNKYIVDLTSYEEYPEVNRIDAVKVIRKSKISGSFFEQPSTWTTMDKENLAIVTLLQSSQEYQYVLHDFVQSYGRHNIVKIERIQSRMLYQQYECKLNLLEKQNPTGCINERKLWHDTSNEAVASINNYGFHRSYCGKNAMVYGIGVYFATNANYSARDTYSPRDFNKNKRVYRCRVLTGEYCQGTQWMKVPPNKPGSMHILYDSLVDNPSNPGIFVIFNDTQAYPEYLITFQ